MTSPPPTNHLVPVYTEAPFSIVNSTPGAYSLNVTGMYNLSSVSLTPTAQLYCYHENGAGKNDYWVIILTQLNNVSHGNPLVYILNAMPPINIIRQNFDYSVKVTALNSAGQPFSSGLTVYNSSPPKSDPQLPLTDSIGIPDEVTIFMHVLNSGTWQDVNFGAQYSNTINTENVQWFEISSLDNQSSASAGVAFTMTGRTDSSTPSQVNFETINVFKFDGSLVSNGQLPVTFSFDVGGKLTQIHNFDTSAFSYNDNFSVPCDLVKVTQNQSNKST